jgi:hypothetical protein
MKNNRSIRNTTAVLAVLMLMMSSWVALAAPLPTRARLQLNDDQGQVVGHGEIDGRELELDVLRDQSGFATLTVTSAEGTITYDVHYSDTGEIMLVVDGNIVSLAEFAAANGLRLDLDYENRLDEPKRDDPKQDDPKRDEDQRGDDGRHDDRYDDCDEDDDWDDDEDDYDDDDWDDDDDRDDDCDD